jgi:glutamate-1-semialdehyde 2,1-aminomutase
VDEAMKTIAIVQARLGSKRFPNKVLKEVNNSPLIELLLKRLSLAREVDEIVVATTSSPVDDRLQSVVEKLGFKVFRGSESDVLDRYFHAAEVYGAETIVRITGDCPLIDPKLVDSCIVKYRAGRFHYLSNSNPPSFPDGLDTEVFSIASLRNAAQNAIDSYDREHVTPFIRRISNNVCGTFFSENDYSNYRWTVDEYQDYIVVSNIFNYFFPKIDFDWKAIIDLQGSHPHLFEFNLGLKRNQGTSMGSGQKLWKRAKIVIPGGNMLLSKRAEMFLPENWPAYFEKAKGCRVWDLDGNELIDMSLMGVGTNILGYGNEEVDNAVRGAINSGNMTTLNCPEEIYLAEKLVELHPWAEMVKFARSGGEANSIAIRIARAATGKSKVAICGYHGWHDWYLAANLGDGENLDGHLIPGLQPMGVPTELKGTVHTFRYNNFQELSDLVQNHDIGVIKMEVSRNHQPENSFLNQVRALATKKGIVLIFDECTSGFRQTFGGLHKIYGVEPDIAMFGKALGNGYAITAVVGRREVMESAQDTFVSSTFWTERIGPVAALKTLEVMERTESWKIISEIGTSVSNQWRLLTTKYGLDVSIFGIPAMPSFSFIGNDANAYKTFLTQEMLKRGYLATTSLYASVAHTPELLNSYFGNLEEVFKVIQDCNSGLNIYSLLDGPIAHTGFARLN